MLGRSVGMMILAATTAAVAAADPAAKRGERVQYRLRSRGEPVTGVLVDFDDHLLRVRPQGSADAVDLDRLSLDKLEVWRKRPTAGGALLGAVLVAPIGIVGGGLCDFQGTDSRSCTRDQIQGGLAMGAIGGLIGYGLFRSHGWVPLEPSVWRGTSASLDAGPGRIGARITVRF